MRGAIEHGGGTLDADDGPRGAAPSTAGRVGRYVLLERVGEGGMGMVFAASDPELDRKVALKILRGAKQSGESRARLAREAQALARLDHPNVVRVFDVGTTGERDYIAMELVEGPTLAGWLAERDHAWRDVLGVLLEAGRGLAAAHEMSVVHRDFKPANVLVGTDGRTRVTDFGLARGMGAGSVSMGHSPARSLDAFDGELDSAALTQAGTVMGTPAYMAPEQHRGERATALSDQYAYCVSCFEALYGRRPFSARSHRELARLKTRGALPPPPKSSAVPRSIRRALERGLAPNPEHRWPSMSALLLALEKADGARRPKHALVMVGALVVGGSLAWLAWPQHDEVCSGAAERVERVWSEQHRAAAAAAFGRSNVAWAHDAWPRVAQLVDGHALEWIERHADACEQGKRGTADLLDRRMACLGERLAELESLVQLLAEADAGVVEHAMQAAMGLSALSDCDDPRAHDTESLASLDASTARQIETLRRRSARIDVLLDAGKHDWARNEASAILEVAQQIGHPPTIAEARRELGTALERSGRYDEAVVQLEEAFWEAEAAAATRVAAGAAVDLVWLFGHRKLDLDRSLEWGRHARAAIHRLGRNDYDEGRLALMLGSSFTSAGQHARARREFEDALALFERSVGPEHLEVATALNNLASALLIEGRYDDARGPVERALALYVNAYGPDHLMVANATINLAGIEQRTGNLERAIELGQRALDIRLTALGPNHPDIATARNNLGAFHSAVGDYARAESHYRAATENMLRTYGDDHPISAAARVNLGLVVERRGRFAEALEILQPAFETLVAALPTGHAHTIYARLGLARAELGLAQHLRAGQWLDPARTRCEADELDPILCAWVSFERARVRWHDERTRASAVTEAEDALERLRGRDTPAEVAHAEAWLLAHRL